MLLGLGQRERWRSLVDLLPTSLLILIVLGAIYGGIATPTEAAELGVVAAIVFALVARKLSFRLLRGQTPKEPSNLINLDSTSGLRRASSLRILAAKRGYVSKSIHMHKACRQWSQHVYPHPLFSSQTTPEWLFRVSFEMKRYFFQQRRRERARIGPQDQTLQDERVRHAAQTTHLTLSIVFLRALSGHHQVPYLRRAAHRLRLFELKR